MRREDSEEALPELVSNGNMISPPFKFFFYLLFFSTFLLFFTMMQVMHDIELHHKSSTHPPTSIFFITKIWEGLIVTILWRFGNLWVGPNIGTSNTGHSYCRSYNADIERPMFKKGRCLNVPMFVQISATDGQTGVADEHV